MIKMIQYEEKVYTGIVLFLHFYVYFIKTIDGPRGIDKKNSQFLLNVYFNTPIFFSKVICFTQLAFFHKLNSIVKRVSSVVVLFLRYFAGMKKPQKMKLQTILFSWLFTYCDDCRIYRFQAGCILKRGHYVTS